MPTPIPDSGTDVLAESQAPQASDQPNIRKQNFWVGIICTLASAGIFGLIALHQWNPNHLYGAPHSGAFVNHGRVVHEMPTWMAAGAGGLFGLVGLTSLISAILGVHFSKSARDFTSMSILIYFCGFADFICIHSALTGETFIDLPFLPQKLSGILSWIVWGLFILLFSVFTVAGLVKMCAVLRFSGKHGDGR